MDRSLAREWMRGGFARRGPSTWTSPPAKLAPLLASTQMPRPVRSQLQWVHRKPRNRHRVAAAPGSTRCGTGEREAPFASLRYLVAANLAGLLNTPTGPHCLFTRNDVPSSLPLSSLPIVSMLCLPRKRTQLAITPNLVWIQTTVRLLDATDVFPITPRTLYMINLSHSSLLRLPHTCRLPDNTVPWLSWVRIHTSVGPDEWGTVWRMRPTVLGGKVTKTLLAVSSGLLHLIGRAPPS
ncbi:hypothetical protein BKA66DRAFT_548867 [Pyrenochaeta sp. MPI-SDFR-AT-0127]|nr:hypothetical protein BKA66DRAFT_548867 [Pyrenochaeta sp. MPI-SDFR-AT-0127]